MKTQYIESQLIDNPVYTNSYTYTFLRSRTNVPRSNRVYTLNESSKSFATTAGKAALRMYPLSRNPTLVPFGSVSVVRTAATRTKNFTYIETSPTNRRRTCRPVIMRYFSCISGRSWRKSSAVAAGKRNYVVRDGILAVSSRKRPSTLSSRIWVISRAIVTTLVSNWAIVVKILRWPVAVRIFFFLFFWKE